MNHIELCQRKDWASTVGKNFWFILGILQLFHHLFCNRQLLVCEGGPVKGRFLKFLWFNTFGSRSICLRACIFSKLNFDRDSMFVFKLWFLFFPTPSIGEYNWYFFIYIRDACHRQSGWIFGKSLKALWAPYPPMF